MDLYMLNSTCSARLPKPLNYYWMYAVNSKHFRDCKKYKSGRQLIRLYESIRFRVSINNWKMLAVTGNPKSRKYICKQ